jgi:hypothetical protein
MPNQGAANGEEKKAHTGPITVKTEQPHKAQPDSNKGEEERNNKVGRSGKERTLLVPKTRGPLESGPSSKATAWHVFGKSYKRQEWQQGEKNCVKYALQSFDKLWKWRSLIKSTNWLSTMVFKGKSPFIYNQKLFGIVNEIPYTKRFSPSSSEL